MPPAPTKHTKVRRENPVEAFLVTRHGGEELTVIVTTDISEALKQAREEESVQEAIRKDGGIWIMPLRD
jgi:hypothetical protein